MRSTDDRKLCVSCGKPATTACQSDCGMAVCGAPLCNNCWHVYIGHSWRHEPIPDIRKMTMDYDFDYYKGLDLRAPRKPIKPVISRDPDAVEARAFADALEGYEREVRAYEEDRSFYQHSLTARDREFKEKLKKDYGLDDAEFGVIWGEAYDRAHSGGLEEIYHQFDQLFDFAERYADIVLKKKK